MHREYKSFEFKLGALDPTGRTIEGYAAVFGNLDQGGDIIHPGAFAKTLAERGNKVKFLWQHDQHEPLGRITELREDGAGLFVKATISDTARGRDALALLRDNAIGGMSIGYDAVKGGTDYSQGSGGDPIRNLRELKLWELSLVTFPMNEEAGVTALKDKGTEQGGFIGTVAQAGDCGPERIINLVVKSGRVISKANGARIMAALESLKAATESLESMLEAAGIGDDEQEGDGEPMSEGEPPADEEMACGTRKPKDGDTAPDTKTGRDSTAETTGAGPLSTAPTQAERARLLAEIDLYSTIGGA